MKKLQLRQQFLLHLLISFITGSVALIPQSPQDQTRRAIASVRSAIVAAREQKKPCRFYVDYLIPLPVETKAEDIDPWPGGLAQMYPYGSDITSELLQGIVDEPNGPCSSQVLSAPDCCGLFIQESSVAAQNDVAAILFPGVDQLENIAQVDEMVGNSRTLLVINKQFQRPADFGLTSRQQENSKTVIFDRFSWGFAFQEFVCRGEDTKLTYEHPEGWKSSVICDENVDIGTKEFDLLSAQQERPLYDVLEKKINKVLPEPLWMRKMGEAQEKGLKFQRDP